MLAGRLQKIFANEALYQLSYTPAKSASSIGCAASIIEPNASQASEDAVRQFSRLRQPLRAILPHKLRRDGDEEPHPGPSCSI
jgi:hypothetical protein